MFTTVTRSDAQILPQHFIVNVSRGSLLFNNHWSICLGHSSSIVWAVEPVYRFYVFTEFTDSCFCRNLLQIFVRSIHFLSQTNF